MLREDPDKRHPWLKRILRKGPPAYTFYLHPRDEAGGRILSDLCDRGINNVANAVGQSAEHVLSFFEILRTELAFYVGCLNLRDKLATLEAPVCFPQPEAVGVRRQRFSGLYDVCLALTMRRRVVGNEHDLDQQEPCHRHRREPRRQVDLPSSHRSRPADAAMRPVRRSRCVRR